MPECKLKNYSVRCCGRTLKKVGIIVVCVATLLSLPAFYCWNLSAGTAFAPSSLPPNLADNSFQEITGYTGQFLISSQTAQAYDPERDVVYLWGGHPPGGGFPQPDELFIWDVANGAWRVPRPANLTPSAQCIGAGPANNIYDEALHGYLKIGNLLNMKGQWFRVPKMIGVTQIYTPSDNDWHYMNPLGFPEGQPYTNINTGGARVYDRNSGTVLYGTPSTAPVAGAIYDTWRNSVTLMGSWNWLTPHVTTGGEVVFDPNNNKYYFFDAESGRTTKWYTPGDPSWQDKTPAALAPEWSWNGSTWVQNTTYPPLGRGSTTGTSMDAAAAWDDLNRRALFFIPIAVPLAGSQYQEWQPNYMDGDPDQSVRPTLSSGGWQGYRYTSLVKFAFSSGNSFSAPIAGQFAIQGASRGRIYAVQVNTGSFSAGDATGWVYFRPSSWNGGPFTAGSVDLYQSDGATLVKSSFATLTSFQSGGTTGSSEPAWPTGNVIGQLIQDGTMTWTVEAYVGQPRIEIWAYNPSANSWQRMGQIDGLVSHRAGDLSVSYLRKRNLFFLADLSTNGGSGIGNKYYYYRYANGSILDYPKNPSIVVNANSINLSWDAVPGATGYNVYRGTGNPAIPWQVAYNKINGSPLASMSYTDTSVSSGSTYFYHITAISGGLESIYSPLVRSDVRAMWDGYVQVASTNSQNINWAPAQNAVSYNVYRAPVTYSVYTQGGSYSGDKDFITAPMRELVRSIDNVGTFVKLNSSPVSGISFVDSANLTGGNPGTYKIYAYRVTAVNALGVESGPSAYWLTIPDQPRRLQWTENWPGSTGTVQLEWKSPPQTGVTYRVYYSVNADAASMKEATTSAISGTNYTINGISKALSAIYVTAVDGLGQEGIPSPRADIQRPAVNMWDSYGYLNAFHVLSGQPPATPTGLLLKKAP